MVSVLTAHLSYVYKCDEHTNTPTLDMLLKLDNA